MAKSRKSNEVFESILEGIEDATNYMKAYNKQKERKRTGKRKYLKAPPRPSQFGKTHRIKVEDTDVKALRERLKLSQSEFANIFCISIDTLQNWEQGRRSPRGPAKVLLNVINKDPKSVLKALAS